MLNVCQPRNSHTGGPMIPIRVMASTSMASTDIGRFLIASTSGEGFGFLTGTTLTPRVTGYLALVPNSPTTGWSTNLVYMRKLMPGVEYAVKFTTTNTTTLPATTDLGGFIGISSGTSAVLGAVLDMAGVGSTVRSDSTVVHPLFQITGYDNTARRIFGVPLFGYGSSIPSVMHV
jgi:hypothetical protein